ncbi:MAG: PKD domain-containing protein [Chromatiaceae bacterium]|nr:PKD domain-containing protein [Chromatiaceae bacterium]
MKLTCNAVVSIFLVTLLTACGGGENEGAESKPVTVKPVNNPPVADAGSDLSVNLGEVVNLDGSASSDPEGDSLTYKWTLLNGPETGITFNDSVTTSFTPRQVGNYEISLVVSDGALSSTEAVVLVTVVQPNKAPYANISGQTYGKQGLPISFNGEQSVDDEGSELSYKWSFKSVPEGSAISEKDLPQEASTSFTPDLAGMYVVQLIVNDGQLDSSAVTLDIKVDPNEQPVVAAQINIAFPIGGEAYIYSDVFDPDSTEFSYSWEIISAPVGSSLVGYTYDKPYLTYVPDLPGNYSAVVTVSDGFSSVTSNEVTAEIIQAEYGYKLGGSTQFTGKINQPILIDFSTSDSPKGKQIEYSWSLKSGPGGSSPSLTKSIINNAETIFTANKAGTYRIDVTMNDNDGYQGVTSIYVTLYDTNYNLNPTSVTRNKHFVKLGDEVVIDGRKSNDFEGDLINYDWGFAYQPYDSGLVIESSKSVIQKFKPTLPGFYNVYLKVKDKNSSNESLSAAWFYVYENQPKTVAFTDKLVFAKTGQTIVLDGSKSVGVDTSIEIFWDLINSPYNSFSEIHDANSLTASFQVDASGKYVFQLRLVKDGEVVSIEHLTVRASQNAMPVADAGEDLTIVSGATAELSASSSFDPEEAELSYNWSVISAEADSASSVYFEDSTLEDATLILPEDYVGQVVIGLTVSDGVNESIRDEVVLTVSASGKD